MRKKEPMNPLHSTMVHHHSIAHIFLGLLLLGSLAAGAAVAAPPTHAAAGDPVSCNLLIKQYFQTGLPNGSAAAFSATTDDINQVATYTEGHLFLQNPILFGSPDTVLAAKLGTRYFSNRRYGPGLFP